MTYEWNTASDPFDREGILVFPESDHKFPLTVMNFGLASFDYQSERENRWGNHSRDGRDSR